MQGTWSNFNIINSMLTNSWHISSKKILTTGLASSHHKYTPIIVLWPQIGLNHGQEEIKGLPRPKPPSLREIVLYVTKPHHQEDDPSMVNKAIFK
jgi:hypothetical protein